MVEQGIDKRCNAHLLLSWRLNDGHGRYRVCWKVPLALSRENEQRTKNWRRKLRRAHFAPFLHIIIYIVHRERGRKRRGGHWREESAHRRRDYFTVYGWFVGVPVNMVVLLIIIMAYKMQCAKKSYSNDFSLSLYLWFSFSDSHSYFNSFNSFPQKHVWFKTRPLEHNGLETNSTEFLCFDKPKKIANPVSSWGTRCPLFCFVNGPDRWWPLMY